MKNPHELVAFRTLFEKRSKSDFPFAKSMIGNESNSIFPGSNADVDYTMWYTEPGYAVLCNGKSNWNEDYQIFNTEELVCQSVDDKIKTANSYC